MFSRKKIIAGNWKMNKTPSEAIQFTKEFIQKIGSLNQCDIILCPPFTALFAVQSEINDKPNIALGAQNLHFEKTGAYTGEVSGEMLRDIGCRYVIVGHSERRQYFFETDQIVNKKVKAALAADLIPIVCVGESLEQREAGQTELLLRQQIREALKDLNSTEATPIVLAYEPIWAIGTGRTATPAQAQQAHAWIRDEIQKQFNATLAAGIRIQYGGSVNPANAAELLQQADIDGALVGGASLKISDFIQIIQSSVS